MTDDRQPGQGRAVTIASVVAFALTILMRLSSCYERFWLDELHTAWCIWDGIDVVAQRASQGNQTPLYFQAMWCWKLIAGESEILLRLSSVLAVAASAAISVIAITRITANITSGILAGLIFAVESNALFFGTEFRPYPFVILFTTGILWLCGQVMATTRTKPQPADASSIPQPLQRLGIVVLACAATLFHPTAGASLGVLVGLTIVACFACRISRSADQATADLPRKPKLQFHISDLICVCVIAATVLSLWQSSLSESWEHRDQWRAFGLARSYQQLWTIWPWQALAVVPACIAIVATTITRAVAFSFGRSDDGMKVSAIQSHPVGAWPLVFATLLLAAAVLVTTIFFTTSFNDIVPLWHRRYFIAVLPMLIWSAAIFTGAGFERLARFAPSRYRTATLAIGAACAIAGLMWYQGTTRSLTSWNPVFTGRGENWRDAVAWINEDSQPNEFILLDSGLIEATVLRQAQDLEDTIDLGCSRYLQFPISGPYNTNRLDCTDNQLAISPWMKPRAAKFIFATDGNPPETVWILTRSPIAAWKPLLTRIAPQHWEESIYREYGNITVIKLSTPNTTD